VPVASYTHAVPKTVTKGHDAWGHAAATVLVIRGKSGHRKKKARLTNRKRRVLQGGGYAATLQQTLGKRDCSQNDKMEVFCSATGD
jgi:hypothetical protein